MARDPYSVLLDAQEAARRSRERIRELEAALRALTAREPVGYTTLPDRTLVPYCLQCDGPPRGGFPVPSPLIVHAPDCPWVAARALLGEGGG